MTNEKFYDVKVMYENSGNVIDSFWCTEEGIKNFLKERIHTNKPIKVEKDFGGYIDENGLGTINCWTAKGYEYSVKVK